MNLAAWRRRFWTLEDGRFVLQTSLCEGNDCAAIKNLSAR
jgi:hypothetical protein